MYHNVALGDSTCSDDITFRNAKNTTVISSQETGLQCNKIWKPTALGVPVLLFTLALCWSLIAVLEFLLWKSQRDNGLIFAPVINDLPLRDTFLYLYFPTILAVIFSIYWAWIDLETKRMEPYYQLSKADGALGKDSLLLHYPFSFIPLAPLKAFKDRHWPVFWASFAVVLVTWGLVPTQAGIFSVRTVTRASNVTFAISNSSMPYEDQARTLTMRYLQSTYGIAALNETLPPYMTRNFTLAPFEPVNISQEELHSQGTYTAPTTMYDLDLVCEDATHKADNSEVIHFASNTGCNTTTGLDGNMTLGYTSPNSNIWIAKEYVGKYVGYHNGGFANWYLSTSCPKTANTTFMASFAKTKAREEDPPQDVIAIFCHPQYWQQKVSATIDTHTKRPLNVEPIEDKEALPWYMFNTTNFEAMLNSGTLGIRVRGDVLPSSLIPSYVETVTNTSLSIISESAELIQPMVGLALGTPNRPMEDYLDWRNMSEAYADAYRLLFARAMVEVLGPVSKSSEVHTGEQRLVSEAVVLDPIFVHIVVGLLGVVSLATIALLVLSFIRKRDLCTDPNTIASIMALVADNHSLLSDFADLDCCTEEDLNSALSHKRYKLVNDDAGARLFEIANDNLSSNHNKLVGGSNQRRDSPKSIAAPVRPVEFRMWMACLFVILFVALSIALGVISGMAQSHGLVIPSTSVFVQNLLENYIPTAIATLIEPIWILINRLLCMLQPLEELQDCDAKAKDSIDLNYSSLPPQLVVFKALRAKHFVLAAVCAMALFANVLAVAFSGLFFQASVDIQYVTTLKPPYNFKIVALNGSVGPDRGDTAGSIDGGGAYQGGAGEDQFLVAESNFSSNTPLPSWTDDSMFYLPAFTEQSSEAANSSYFEVTTSSLGAELECSELTMGQNFQVQMSNSSYGSIVTLNLTIPHQSGDVKCGTLIGLAAGQTEEGPQGFERTCHDGPNANEIVTQLEPRINATREEKEACMGTVILAWMRRSESTCPIGKKLSLDPKGSLFIQCQPRLIMSSAKIHVNAAGRLQKPAEEVSLKSRVTDSSDGNPFSNDVINIISQSNLYFFQATSSAAHVDKFANDYINYFLKRSTNSSRFVDPSTPVPTFDEVEAPLNKVYSKLFAIWLGVNKRNLLVPTKLENAPQIDGLRVEVEQRIFVSRTMFIISEAILCTYVLVAIWVYARRPGQYLARMPTSVAAVIALFAASIAVQDLRGTSHLNSKGRAQHLERLGSKYGYGSFIGGGDGRVHIGIEKVPLVVKPRARSTWLEQKMPLLRKRTGGLG